LLHGAWGDETADLVERTADDVLNPLAGDTIRSLVAAPREGAGLTLEGGGLAFSAAKESENGDWLVLRCVNLLERPVSGRWVVGGGVREARTSRLDETPGEPLAVAGESVAFEAGPRAVSTVLVR
jgi:alpha-mannosidase